MERTLHQLLALGATLAGVDLAAAAEAASMNIPLAPRYSFQSLKDLPYYEGKDADRIKHRLDLYLPRDHKDFPTLLFVHGGAWQRGDKDGHFGVYGALASFLARHGVGVAVTNYRLSPAVKHPEHVRDVARAFAWVHQNIRKHGGDPGRLFVGGHSAGAHLAALLATDPTYLKAHGLAPAAVRGVVALSGAYFLPEPYFAHIFGGGEERKRAWPLTHVREGLPPFLLLYADCDYPGCDREPAEAFARALRAKGNAVEVVEARESNHFKILLSAALADDPVARAVVSFLHAHAADRP